MDSNCIRIEPLMDTVLDDEVLAYETRRYGYYPSVQAFSQYPITTFKGYQYALYYDKLRHLCVARRKLPEVNWEVARLLDYHHERDDCHNVPVLGLSLGDGRMHLAFDHHGDMLNYRISVSDILTEPEKVTWSASLFSPVMSKLPGIENPLENITYPRFIIDDKGRLYFWRRQGSCKNGFALLYSYNDFNHNWSEVGQITSNLGMYMQCPTRNAYFDGVTFDDRGRLHIAFCWREQKNSGGSPLNNHGLLYAYSDDYGKTWKDNNGNEIGKVGDPISIYDTSAIYYNIGTNRGLLNSEHMTVDGSGRIHLVKAHLPPEEPDSFNWDDSRERSRAFHYWRDIDGKWHVNQLPPSFPSGYDAYRTNIITDKYDNIYVFCNEKIQIWTATSANNYNDWTLTYTYDESAKFAHQNSAALDVRRIKIDGILSYMVHEEYVKPGKPVKLHVIDFKPYYSCTENTD